MPHPAPSLPARFEHWARIQPERPALVITEQGAQSYAALNARSNALAHALLSLGVKRQEPVGVLTDRSLALPETVLAIWKAGGCYLPLVRDLPADRLAFIARDAGIRVLVVLDGHEPPASAGRDRLPNLPAGKPVGSIPQQPRLRARDRGRDVGGSDLAYIIYTSGSTGVPKGVMLRHQGLNNLGAAMDAALEIGSDDRALLMASPAFDAWIADMVMAWAAGAAVVPVLRRRTGRHRGHARQDGPAGSHHRHHDAILSPAFRAGGLSRPAPAADRGRAAPSCRCSALCGAPALCQWLWSNREHRRRQLRAHCTDDATTDGRQAVSQHVGPYSRQARRAGPAWRGWARLAGRRGPRLGISEPTRSHCRQLRRNIRGPAVFARAIWDVGPAPASWRFWAAPTAR